jgi:hypothetical protein
MIEQLQALAGCGRPWAEQRAQMALQMCSALQNHEISESEFKELMSDLVRMDKLNEEADDLETKTMLVTAVYAVAQLA